MKLVSSNSSSHFLKGLLHSLAVVSCKWLSIFFDVSSSPELNRNKPLVCCWHFTAFAVRGFLTPCLGVLRSQAVRTSGLLESAARAQQAEPRKITIWHLLNLCFSGTRFSVASSSVGAEASKQADYCKSSIHATSQLDGYSLFCSSL